MFRIEKLIWKSKSMVEFYHSVAIRKQWRQQLDAVDSREITACSSVVVDMETGDSKEITGVELCELVSEGRIFQVVNQKDWYFCCCWSEREFQLSKYIDENVETSIIIDYGDLWYTYGLNTIEVRKIAEKLSSDIELYTRVLGASQFSELLLNKSVHKMPAPFYYVNTVDDVERYPRNIGDYLLRFREYVKFVGGDKFMIVRKTVSGAVVQTYTYNPKMNLELL